MIALECRSRVLCVDDEPNVLHGLRRTLYEEFEVITALSGAEGLGVLEVEGPFAVVVSDMRMPEMDGAQFLAETRQRAPDTVRVLLTGQADVNSAIAAINEGNIFRFLTKPCPPDVLVPTLRDAAGQHRLLLAERELLESTLKGAVQVLTDVLSLASPAAFSRAWRVKTFVSHMVRVLGLHSPWRFEVAAMLSQIGCIALPPDTLHKVYAQQPISDKEQEMLDKHPQVGGELLGRIPRMEGVAEMVAAQRDPTLLADPEHRRGAEMLRIALAIDTLVNVGVSVISAVARLERTEGYDAGLLWAMRDFSAVDPGGETIRSVPLDDLTTAMVLDEPVRSVAGNVVIAMDRPLTAALIERLKNFARGVGIAEPIRVRIPTSSVR